MFFSKKTQPATSHFYLTVPF